MKRLHSSALLALANLASLASAAPGIYSITDTRRSRDTGDPPFAKRELTISDGLGGTINTGGKKEVIGSSGSSAVAMESIGSATKISNFDQPIGPGTGTINRGNSGLHVT